MEKPLVSIIVPTYNVERYIEECIDALLAQTYPNTEIIVLDDASTDATVYLLKQYTEEIILIENEKNEGQGARRNQGLQIAKGKYIYFMDADDWLEKEALEELVSQAEDTHAELVRFNGTAFYQGDQALIRENNYDFSGMLENNMLYKGEEALLKNRKAFNPSPCLYLVNKAVIDLNDLSFIEGVLHEDEYFTTVLFANTQSMTYLNKNYYHRRYRTASTMTEQTKQHKLRSFNSYIKVFQALEAEYKLSDYSKLQKQFIKRQLLSIYNALVVSDVHPEMKRQLKQFKTVTFKDKLFVLGARLKQHLER
ncbi:Glycosyltransferase involved in cell wall bisynthesis [Alkalibacterium subtropicum]|uniref:Glycosyltransferase involved in cell wall bisynthesis n=1 Tax=Alkalibacterium subtropicum TaxID=753702 RepID=A0A1I1GJB6_9LACT|nr:glycosyltransferase family 2 protein [Alkalibacterium subtropicum]SFC11362.1 Glycosyltransferase involved in cell wall bisynthesis [Alkalibacterium subtropicum]